eukprot:1863300-Rhodomonas_salina.2
MMRTVWAHEKGHGDLRLGDWEVELYFHEITNTGHRKNRSQRPHNTHRKLLPNYIPESSPRSTLRLITATVMFKVHADRSESHHQRP